MSEFIARTVLVTGAAGQLGRAVGFAFLKAGARLVALDLDAQRLAAAYPEQGDRIVHLPANICEDDALIGAVAALCDRIGPIHVLCNIAGGFAMGPPVHETPPSLWNSMMQTNALTVINAARAVVPHMLAAGYGKVVNVAAGAGVSGRPNMGAYSASKGAVMRLTESMAAELRERAVNVNCILPAIIDTPANRAAMPDADPGRWVPPADIADLVLFLASERARSIHGACIPIAGKT